jgi:hypothetical protein
MGDIVDVILGLTGPQMVGAPFACELDLDASKQTVCYFVGVRYPRPRRDVGVSVRAIDDAFWRERKFWVSLGGGVYGSSWKNSGMKDFEFARVWMLAFEPTVNRRLFSFGRETPTGPDKFVIELGAGPSVLSLWGEGFDAFAKGGIKVTPSITRRFEGSRHIVGFGYTLRFFPNAFTSQDFDRHATTSTHQGREFAHGFKVTLNY